VFSLLSLAGLFVLEEHLPDKGAGMDLAVLIQPSEFAKQYSTSSVKYLSDSQINLKRR
jgi:hypothetical protein